MSKLHDDRAYLFDIAEGCRNIESFISGMNFEQFERDLKTNLATQQQIIIMGEAANKVSGDIKKRYPTIPWREMIGVRNILVHGYMSVDLKIVWDIAFIKVKNLGPEVDKIIEDLT